jgi:hypothetical protein
VRLIAKIKPELTQAAEKSGRAARYFKDFSWSTRDSWRRRRRVVGKAERTRGGSNPRFVVTSLTKAECKARYLYEQIYCALGDMENRIKECQIDLLADRISMATMRANQLRLWFASMAYVLVCALRRIGLCDTDFAEATCGTIRLNFLKIGALVCVSVRRIKVAMEPYAGRKTATGRCRSWIKIVGVGNGKSLPVAAQSRPLNERRTSSVWANSRTSRRSHKPAKSRWAEAIPAGNDQQRKAGTGLCADCVEVSLGSIRLSRTRPRRCP